MKLSNVDFFPSKPELKFLKQRGLGIYSKIFIVSFKETNFFTNKKECVVS